MCYKKVYYIKSTIQSLLYKEHDNNLGDDDSDKHSQRIHRGVADARGVAIQRLVGIGECHRIRHASTEDSTDASEIILLGLQDDEAHDGHRNHRDEETDAYPHQTLGTNHRLEKLSTSRQAQAAQVEGNTQ